MRDKRDHARELFRKAGSDQHTLPVRPNLEVNPRLR
jgi:hypothetical protein